MSRRSMGFAAPAIPYVAAAGTSILANKLGGDKNTQQSNPNSPELQQLQSQFADFFGNLLNNPNQQGFMTSDLQRSSLGGIQQFLQQESPEVTTFNNLQPGLMDMFNQDISGFSEAAFPLFQRGLQEGLGNLSNQAAGRFSTTFENQGIGLTQRALQDFNLLQQQAFQQNVGNRLGAASLLGTLSGQAGQNPFNRLATAGGLGLQATQGNPLLQLLLGGMNFARPAPNDTIVGDSALDAGLKGIAGFVGLKDFLSGSTS